MTYLDSQRNHVLGILEGITDEDLRRPVAPSGWSCLGLVQHLALDIERFWFRRVVAGADVNLKDGTEAWQVADDASAEEILALYRQEIALSNEVLAATPVGAMPAWWPDFFEDYPIRPVRAVILHVIAETAAHAGHLDIVREVIDGRQWFVIE
jgi:hypothetical protein